MAPFGVCLDPGTQFLAGGPWAGDFTYLRHSVLLALRGAVIIL